MWPQRLAQRKNSNLFTNKRTPFRIILKQQFDKHYSDTHKQHLNTMTTDKHTDFVYFRIVLPTVSRLQGSTQ